MIILGINAYHGDASAAIVVDGKLVAAAEEERFNRIKHSAGFPVKAIEYCLKEASATLKDVDYIAISRKPSANLHRKITFMLLKGSILNKMLKQRLANAAKILDIKNIIAANFHIPIKEIRATVHRVEHHLAHAASAFYVSPFEEATIVTIDGFGDFCSTTIGYGKDKKIFLEEKIIFPHSLGIFYTAFCQFLGFRKYGDEGKVMGLAPYGEPIFFDKMKEILLSRENSFELNLEYFIHHSDGVDMTWESGSPQISTIYSNRFTKEFGKPREPNEPLLDHHKNIAASMQLALEDAAFSIIKYAIKKRGIRNLSLAGGVAFNSVMNGKIKDKAEVEELFIQPAAGDAGTAIGAAFYVYHHILGQERSYLMKSAYTGPSYTEAEIRKVLEAYNIKYEYVKEPSALAAKLIAEGKIIGWFQGRMEFGPRALGNRSILADPRRAEIKDILNARIKHRESFRPFAPSILWEHTNKYFEKSDESPFMLLVYPIKYEKRKEIPAVTHVDGTGRLQTVKKEDNAQYYELIENFYKITGVPVVLNTSFNENEPIVCSPEDAVKCFNTTHMDALFLSNFLIKKG